MSIPIKILVVDDEPQIRRFLRSSFSSSEFRVVEAGDGANGIRLAASEQPNIVLLDLGLPDMDGVDVVTAIREWSTIPVIILTARGHEDDKVEALDAGADDYLTKPFSVRELEARVRVMLRRELAGEGKYPVVEFGECKIDLGARLVYCKDVAVPMTPIEYRLLAFMARYADKVVTHRMLVTEVWGPGYDYEVQNLRVHMRNLRHKLEDEPANPRYILTEAGVGYRLVTHS